MPPRAKQGKDSDAPGVTKAKLKQVAGAVKGHGTGDKADMKELEERRRQLKEQLQQVEVQVRHAACDRAAEGRNWRLS